MTTNFLKLFALAGMLIAVGPLGVNAQTPSAEIILPPSQSPAAPQSGPHGGTLRQAGALQLETLVHHGGIQVFVFDDHGRPLPVDGGRGAVSLHVDGNAKRYRYDLLPDGKGGMAAPVNLSHIAGRQIELDFQLVGLPGIGRQPLTVQEVTTVPVSEQQLAAAAIARQKTCPVSGKPLGSMGEPVAVHTHGQTVYACCAACVKTIESHPDLYSAGRPQITVTTPTQADAALIAKQGKCPVMDETLGSMGQPVKVTVGDQPIFLCCRGCLKKVQAEPAKYVALVHRDKPLSVPAGTEQVREGIFRVSAADAPFIAAQQRCPVMDEPLHAMGGPYKVHAAGKAIYICCPGCAKRIAAEPQQYLTVLAERGVQAPVLK